MGCNCNRKSKTSITINKYKKPKNDKNTKSHNHTYTRICCKRNHICKRSSVAGFIDIREPTTPIDIYGNL